ncbi:hypothetical protein [Hydrogenophaga sp.]|uniref:hypothetical protein n=1 Tax=Hydrogenophaga sp. TaxID=1904254 RepID=UPI00273097CE|nr:hypothetical protein [Hydrogenophaga sp.]MDP2019114.1 hypothetical protein [Hydrogenophaga sp.]MDP3167839.1 hypothetical protein [Hydrogenophaga sp.]MDP3811578.1 hypothetical protein [Hydrogenophaga sp.]
MLRARSLSQLPDKPAQRGLPAAVRTIFTQRANAAVPLHWLSTAAAFSGTGGLVSGDDLAELIRHRCEVAGWLPESLPVSLVARWIVSRAVVSLDSPWGPLFPLFQFNLPTASLVDAMAPLLDELRPVFDDVELALWFVTPNDWLGGARPVSAMHHSLPAVLQAARADRFVAGGH